MARYVISDHHFGHSRIIGYTGRPFSSVGEMNDELLDRHYNTVDADDVLIHLGDVAMDMQDGQETIEYFERLGGDVLCQGNHDVGLDPEDAPFPLLDACRLEHDGYDFYCTHRPEDVPDEWDNWVLHGHMHNNEPDEFPFIAPEEQRVNVSCELVDYRPVKLDALTSLLDVCQGPIQDIHAAKDVVQ
jgi:calcineurin-like phosphoesterase family protein